MFEIDRTPVILTLIDTVIRKDNSVSLYNSKTDWDACREYLNSKLNLKIPLKNNEHIENAVQYFAREIQSTATLNKPNDEHRNISNNYPRLVKEVVCQKKDNYERKWFRTRYFYVTKLC